MALDIRNRYADLPLKRHFHRLECLWTDEGHPVQQMRFETVHLKTDVRPKRSLPAWSYPDACPPVVPVCDTAPFCASTLGKFDVYRVRVALYSTSQASGLRPPQVHLLTTMHGDDKCQRMIGGRFSRTKDGGDPTTLGALVKAGVRLAWEQCCLDLSPCRSWHPMLELQYDCPAETVAGKFYPRQREVTVVFLVDATPAMRVVRAPLATSTLETQSATAQTSHGAPSVEATGVDATSEADENNDDDEGDSAGSVASPVVQDSADENDEDAIDILDADLHIAAFGALPDDEDGPDSGDSDGSDSSDSGDSDSSDDEPPAVDSNTSFNVVTPDGEESDEGNDSDMERLAQAAAVAAVANVSSPGANKPSEVDTVEPASGLTKPQPPSTAKDADATSDRNHTDTTQHFKPFPNSPCLVLACPPDSKVQFAAVQGIMKFPRRTSFEVRCELQLQSRCMVCVSLHGLFR